MTTTHRSHDAQPIDLAERFAAFSEHWRPKVVAEANGQEFKVVRFKGTFVWHRHDDADEVFLGWRGRFRVEFRDRVVEVGPGQMIVVPRGVEHRTVADEEAAVVIVEPSGTRNTGDVEHPELTAPTGVRL